MIDMAARERAMWAEAMQRGRAKLKREPSPHEVYGIYLDLCVEGGTHGDEPEDVSGVLPG